MDSGLAALLGAAVGASVTGGATVLTGWWTTRHAKWQATAQLRSEHLRQIRADRREVYRDFIDLAHSAQRRFADALGQYSARGVLPDVSDLWELGSEIERQAVRVSLEGPASLDAPAFAVVPCPLLMAGAFAFLADDTAGRAARVSSRRNPTYAGRALRPSQTITPTYDSEETAVHFIEDQITVIMRNVAAFSDVARSALDDDGLRHSGAAR